MNEEFYLKRDPAEYIMELFKNTKDGKVDITYYSETESHFDRTYKIDWTREDAEDLVKKYKALISAVTEIGKLHDKLDTEENRKNLLSPEALAVWNIYFSPFDETFDVDKEYLSELYDRYYICGADLDEDEYYIICRHAEWLDKQFLKKLPAEKRYPTEVIVDVRHYEDAVRKGASEYALKLMAYYLVCDMVLYYFCEEPPRIYY